MDKPITILIADDDADDLVLFCHAVNELDPEIECMIASDGYEALLLLRDIHKPLPDYIFLDLRMPKMSGKKCLQQIRSDARLKNIPVIIYTTSDEVQDTETLTELGATHFVTKPTNPEEIFYLVSMILSEKWV